MIWLQDIASKIVRNTTPYDFVTCKVQIIIIIIIKNWCARKVFPSFCLNPIHTTRLSIEMVKPSIICWVMQSAAKIYPEKGPNKYLVRIPWYNATECTLSFVSYKMDDEKFCYKVATLRFVFYHRPFYMNRTLDGQTGSTVWMWGLTTYLVGIQRNKAIYTRHHRPAAKENLDYQQK